MLSDADLQHMLVVLCCGFYKLIKCLEVSLIVVNLPALHNLFLHFCTVYLGLFSTHVCSITLFIVILFLRCMCEMGTTVSKKKLSM